MVGASGPPAWAKGAAPHSPYDCQCRRRSACQASRALAVTERRVLVVEDDQTLREVIAEALREDGYAVLTAVNGEAALELAQRWLPGMVILDLMMPRMAGEEFCAALRALDGLATIPILLVSASRSAADIGE